MTTRNEGERLLRTLRERYAEGQAVTTADTGTDARALDYRPLVTAYWQAVADIRRLLALFEYSYTVTFVDDITREAEKRGAHEAVERIRNRFAIYGQGAGADAMHWATRASLKDVLAILDEEAAR